MKRILDLIRKYEGILVYLCFGVLTTLVNYIVYFPLFNWLKCSAVFSNVIAWVAAVIFAFLTNKPFVFKSHDWSAKTVVNEASKFIGCRVGSGVLETVIVWLFVDVLLLNGNWTKIAVSILVVLLNYISSKWLVFRKK